MAESNEPASYETPVLASEDAENPVLDSQPPGASQRPAETIPERKVKCDICDQENKKMWVHTPCGHQLWCVDCMLEETMKDMILNQGCPFITDYTKKTPCGSLVSNLTISESSDSTASAAAPAAAGPAAASPAATAAPAAAQVNNGQQPPYKRGVCRMCAIEDTKLWIHTACGHAMFCMTCMHRDTLLGSDCPYTNEDGTICQRLIYALNISIKS